MIENGQKSILKFGQYPSKKDTELFRFFYIDDDGKQFFTARKKLHQYKLKEFMHDLSNSPWKTGFMKSVFVIPFPYYVIYQDIKKMIRFIEDYMLKKYDVISFDIFDTLIERTCSVPADIFELTGEAVLGKDKALQFRADRIEAEHNARHKKTGGEVNISDIYNELDSAYAAFSQQLMAEEQRQEIVNCKKKESMYGFFQKCVASDKCVILVSDMYLPEQVIIKMLEKCGIAGYDDIYISNCYNSNKLTGKLFELVMDERGTDRKKIIHIGDSVKADYIGARKAGIRSILIGRKNRLKRQLNSK